MVPAAFRRKVSPVTSSISLQCWSIVEILRYVTQRTWVSAQSNPMYHLIVILVSPKLPGGSGPYIIGGRPQRPSHHRLAQECCQGKNDLFVPVKPCGDPSLSPAVVIEQVSLCSALDQKGSSK